MKIGRVALAMATALVVMSVAMMQVAEAQGPTCLTVAGGGAPFSDATAVVQQLRVTPGQCCNTNGAGFCTVVLTSGNAAASVCGTNVCPNCADVGNDLNEVLAQCNVLNEVEGVYSPDGTSDELYYLTSASNHP
ncbi:hypothetical protein BDL97_14G051200 [Sphagnum fallax]|jgi:hypothetical protein|nr:hypothetical protein BDL97_14G051100 [Sphagnum fallax]KAH8941612.1 hypothetical protein BDL97_14G051200 [Sphagnum fallax]